MSSGRPGAASRDAFLDALPDNLRTYERTGYHPVTEPGEYGTGSGFGGAGIVSDAHPHPRCPSCARPMALFVQLDLASVPVPAAGTGLMQLWYCLGDCTVDLGDWEPFAGSHLGRLTPVTGVPTTEGEQVPPRRITGWTPVRDIPDYEDLRSLNLDIPDALADAAIDARVPDEGDKLGGWPAWVQGPEIPDCPQCGAAMTYVFQLDSEKNVPYMFGDAGIGHLTQCPRHPDVIGFGWACG
jgi:hypothetical protein